MASQPPLKFRKRHPVFSAESSDTEYTSSDSEEAAAEENKKRADSQPNDGSLCGIRPVEFPGEDLAPSMTPHIVSLERVFIDLGDSDEEMDASSQDVEILEVQTPKVRLVVDLSDNRVTHPGMQQVEAKKDLVMDSQIIRPCSGLSPEVPRVSLGQPEECVLLAAKESEDLARVSMAQPEERVILKAEESKGEARVSMAQPGDIVIPTAAEESEDEARVSMAQPGDIVVPTAAEESEDEAGVSMAQPGDIVVPTAVEESEDEAGVSMAQPGDIVVPTAAEESEDEASTISGNYKRSPGLVEVFPPDWSRGVMCDICERGPSLSFGAWYSWCCGKPSRGCDCTCEDQQQKRKVLTGKSVTNPKANDNLAHVWSGKVHRLCALWSAEVYQNSEEPWIMMELETAMRRSRKVKCSDCSRLGATLGCRVKSCKKTYHYPCADRLSAFVKVRTWDGYVKPIACKDHRHEEVKQKKRKRGKPAKGAGSSRSRESTLGGANAIEIGSGDLERSQLHEPTDFIETTVSGSRARVALPPPMGKNLLTLDFSYGCEKSIPVPCTNDVDDELPPYIEYLTKTRFRNHPLGSKDCPQPPPERLAKACKRHCTQHNLDDPSAPLSVHVPFERREDDDREDWLEERMYGRVPYDKHGRLLIGTKFNELVECNERCECDELCSNREMQKGLRTPIELYKTENKGWALRTLVAIPRGKFVIEYVGEMMTQDQAQRYGQDNDYKRSYMQELDYPESKRTPDFLLDAFHASNVARFINHSCDPNLKMYRVYVETTYKWLPHIGFYAMRDIEAGEELAHDYKFGRHDEDNEQEKDLTHVKCYCGAKNCREWLLVRTEVEG